MKLSRTTIEIYQGKPAYLRPPGIRAGVSLHGHSDCSRESLDFLPRLARGIPYVAAAFDWTMAACHRERGRPFDFASMYWRPPVTPADFMASERAQIENRFECAALVALTDHDTLEGPSKLRAIGAGEVPLSVEWTIPIDETVLHLGVHGIPPHRLEE